MIVCLRKMRSALFIKQLLLRDSSSENDALEQLYKRAMLRQEGGLHSPRLRLEKFVLEIIHWHLYSLVALVDNQRAFSGSITNQHYILPDQALKKAQRLVAKHRGEADMVCGSSLQAVLCSSEGSYTGFMKRRSGSCAPEREHCPYETVSSPTHGLDQLRVLRVFL